MFGDKLKFLRNMRDLKQKDIAKLLNVSPSTIGMYEQNRRDPDTETIKFLANYFEVTTDYLLDEKNITIAANRTDDPMNDLPPEAIEEIERFKEFVRHKYKSDR